MVLWVYSIFTHILYCCMTIQTDNNFLCTKLDQIGLEFFTHEIAKPLGRSLECWLQWNP